MNNQRPEDQVARAIAFFEASTDAELLRGVLKTIQPKAAAEARRFGRRLPPDPAPITAAPEAASADEAMRTVRGVKDFAQLQALARAVGRRIEVLRSMN